MATEPTNAYRCTKVSYVIYTVCLLHVSATSVAILREVNCKGWVKV
jgi:hypothetical protein